VTAALTNSDTRTEMKQLINDLASLLEVIQDETKKASA
jgi:hypothetical protein